MGLKNYSRDCSPGEHCIYRSIAFCTSFFLVVLSALDNIYIYIYRRIGAEVWQRGVTSLISIPDTETGANERKKERK